MVDDNILDLCSLSIHDIRSVGDLGVNKFLVRDVDQWSKIDDRSTNQGQAPERNKLDQPVAKKGRDKCLVALAADRKCACFETHNTSVHNVLGKKNALELNHKEVDELFNIPKCCFKRLAGNGVITFWSERSHETLRKGQSANTFQCSGRYSAG